MGWNRHMSFGMIVWALLVIFVEFNPEVVKRKCFNTEDDPIQKREGGRQRVLLFWSFGWVLAFLTAFGDLVHDIIWFEMRKNQFEIDKFSFFGLFDLLILLTNLGADCTAVYKRVGVQKDYIHINLAYKVFNTIFRFISNMSLWGLVLLYTTWKWTIPPAGNKGFPPWTFIYPPKIDQSTRFGR
jgi:hypothetical protein